MSVASDIARIMVCDDSRTFTMGLKRFLEEDPDLRVVSTCTTTADAIKLALENDFDLIVMDLELPDAPGTVAIARIMADRPTPILVLSAHAQRGSRLAVEALGAGALDAHAKSEISLREPASARAAMFRRLVKRLARARVAGARRPAAAPTSPPAQRVAAKAVGVAASTGGPRALEAVLRALPARFPLPVLVVQHMAPGFIDGLVEWLDQTVDIPVGLASHGATAAPGVWVAPDGAHLILDESGRLLLDQETIAGYHRPAADVLFASLARSAGAGAVTVVLTGMGSDGADGTAAVRSVGGVTFAQDQATSALYGMPRAAAESGAEHILALDGLGTALTGLPGARVRDV